MCISSRILIVSWIFLIPICDSFPNRAFRRFIHSDRIHENQQFPKSIKEQLSALSETSDIHRKDYLSSINTETEPSKLDKPNTSCGKIMCENLENYPEELIQQLLLKTLNSKLIRLTEKSTENISLKSRFNNVKKNSDINNFDNPIKMIAAASDYSAEEMSYSSTNHIYKSLPIAERLRIHSRRIMPYADRKNYYYHPDLNPERPNCNEQIKLISPKEGVDEDNNSVIIVNTKDFKVITKECIAPEFCQDDRTPEQRIYKCGPKIKIVELPRFNPMTEEINFHRMRVHDGCKCQLVPLSDTF